MAASPARSLLVNNGNLFKAAVDVQPRIRSAGFKGIVITKVGADRFVFFPVSQEVSAAARSTVSGSRGGVHSRGAQVISFGLGGGHSVCRA